MLSKFFTLTFVVSWLWFGVTAYVLRYVGSDSDGIGRVGGLLFIPGVFVPALVALALTARSEGRSGRRAAFAQIFGDETRQPERCG